MRGAQACAAHGQLPEIDADQVDRLLSEGATIPAVFYTDPAIAELEDEVVFRRSRQIVGVEPEVREPGDYLTSQTSGAGFRTTPV